MPGGRSANVKNEKQYLALKDKAACRKASHGG